MNKTNFWKMALALIICLSFSAFVFAQDSDPDEPDNTPDTTPAPVVDAEAQESVPEFAGGGFEFTIPNVFVDGNVLTAAQLNQNFDALGDGIDTKLNRSGNNPNSSFLLSPFTLTMESAGDTTINLDTNNAGTNSFWVKTDVNSGTNTSNFRVTDVGDATVYRDLFVNDDLTVTDILTVNNDATIADVLTVNDDLNVTDDIQADDLYLDNTTHPYLSINPTGTGESQNTIRLYVSGRISTGTLQIRGGADIAEPFDITPSPLVEAAPGMVVSIDPNNPGKLMVSTEAHDTKVAGIISGLAGIQPGLILNQEGFGLAGVDAMPVAMGGRVEVLIDASYGAVEVGDLLTTSPRHGYAMKVTNHNQAIGAVIGKAMTPLQEGTGSVLVLVSLQ